MHPQYFLTGKSEEELEAQALMFLERRGIVVELPHEWERPCEFCARVGISQRTLYRALRSKWSPQVQINRGARGRIICIRSNAIFDKYARSRRRRSRSSPS